MNKRVLVLGSTCVDVIIRVEHLPKTEENLHPSGQRFTVGGCAYNAANILGRGGADITFVTPVGLRGVFGPFVRPLLEKQPWVYPIYLEDAENGCCYCLVEPNGERTFLSIHGAEYTFSSQWMEPFHKASFDYTYICGLEIEESTGDSLVSWLEHVAAGTVFYAPGPRGMRVPAERTERLFDLHPILHLNSAEALQMAGENALPAALDRLFARTGNTVITTLGAEGAMIKDAVGDSRRIPGFPVSHIADTIGAGDAHAGAVLLGLSKDISLDDAVLLANRISAQVVAQEGATLSDTALQAALASIDV